MPYRTIAGIQITHRTTDNWGNKHIVFYRVSNTGALRAIGHVDLDDCGNKYITHSYLDHKWHSRGIGTWMYTTAIRVGLRNGKAVCSSRMASSMAQRVWTSRTLRKYFVVRSRTAKAFRRNRCRVWGVYPKMQKLRKKHKGR